jgi:hypothetical protein
VAVAVCLSWLVPDLLALHRFQPISHADQISSVASGAVLLGRINLFTISNALRYFLPLAIALGPLILFLPWADDALLWSAVLPGSAFFLLVYISDAPYLNCLMSPLILLALLGASRKVCRAWTHGLVSASIVLNAGLYLFVTPLAITGSAAFARAVLNRDVMLYTHHSVRAEGRDIPSRLLEALPAK